MEKKIDTRLTKDHRNALKKENGEHPKFTEGKLAFYNGRKPSDNPYGMDTDFFSKWKSGWEVAFQARRIFEEKSKTTKVLSHSQATDSRIKMVQDGEIKQGIDSNFWKVTEFIEEAFKTIVKVLFGLLIGAGILYALYWVGKAIIGFIKHYSQFA
ncbi:MAG: hypothetical protein WC855_05045 [Thermodesulfovibrionales bacterium]